MIVDWTVDISPESPMILLPWEGWVDLQEKDADERFSWHRNKAAALSEVRQYPELLPLLEAANSCNTCTSKVDVFPVDRDDADPEIAEAGLEATACGLGSYIDLLPLRSDVFAAWKDFEQIARRAATDLKRVELSGGSIEIVVRPAQLYDKQTFGWTLYAIGFGPHEAAARFVWAEAAKLVIHGMRRCISSALLEHGETPVRQCEKEAENTGE